MRQIVGNGTLLKEQLANQLRAAIIDGRLGAGQRVVESIWAREFGVAQASVREAINLLISEGFLVKSAGRSARVPQYSEEDLVRIYQVRASLEGLAARLVAESGADLSAVKSAAQRMKEANTASDVNALIEADLAFHLSLARSSGNSLLTEMLERLLSPLFTFVMLRVRETHGTTASWTPDLPRHAQMIYMIEHSTPPIAAQFVENCIYRFKSSADAVWAPSAHAKMKRRLSGHAK
jgi:DNA-binding GntR family transcriptional regulator